jgi:hypothetical protein
MKVSRRSALVGVLAGLLVAAALFGFVGSGLRPAGSSASSQTASATDGINYRFYDFFNVPFREYWDIRKAFYGDLPMNAECFSAEGVAEGTCVPSDSNVPNLATYPYTHWYPFVGSTSPGRTTTAPFIYAPYRMAAVGTDVPGYTLQDPVYVPIIKPSEAAGTGPLSIDWRMDYLTLAEATTLKNQGCPISLNFVDGYYLRSQIQITLDLQESKRMFGVTATDVASARTWWSGNTNSACGTQGAAESSWQTGMANLGGTQFTVGKFDIYNGYEWYYQPFYTNLGGAVANNGVTTVTIDHVSYGTEMLLARMFYWGSAGYQANYLDSSKRSGWWGMEYPWFEGFHFTTTIGATTHSFNLDTAIFYHFQNIGAPGPNRLYDRTDDVSIWDWGPWLADYVNDFSPKHLLSELDRYPNADDVYVHSTPGSFNYGVSSAFDYTANTWDLKSGESWRFEFPTGNVRFYSPTTPAGADPSKGQYLESSAPLDLFRTVPASYGTWDGTAKTWIVTGPATTGGPAGTPGPDGTAGTSDDLYAMHPWPTLDLRPAPALLRVTTNPAVSGKILVDGVPRDEWGLAWMKIAPGAHTVSFGGVPGFATPADQAVTVTAGATTTAVGDYAALGYLRVITSPAVASTISVNNVPRNDWGMWTALAPGTYTVHYGAVQGYNPPADQSATVTVGATTTITGTFSPNPSAPGPDPTTYGLLRVTTNPAVPSQILVNSVPRDDYGLAWVKLPPGPYTVSFGQIYGFTLPAPKQVTVSAGATTVYDAPFLAHGSLRVMTNPAVAGTIFVDGVPRDDWGMWQSMPPGTYTVSFGDVPGFTTPIPQTATVTASMLTTITGDFVAGAGGYAASQNAGPAFDASSRSLGVVSLPTPFAVATSTASGFGLKASRTGE